MFFPVACNDDSVTGVEVEFTPSGQTAEGNKWETDQKTVVITVEYEPRAGRCLEKCKTICKGR